MVNESDDIQIGFHVMGAVYVLPLAFSLLLEVTSWEKRVHPWWGPPEAFPLALGRGLQRTYGWRVRSERRKLKLLFKTFIFFVCVLISAYFCPEDERGNFHATLSDENNIIQYLLYGAPFFKKTQICFFLYCLADHGVLRTGAEISVVLGLLSCCPSSSVRSLAGPVEKSAAGTWWGCYKGQGKCFDLCFKRTGEPLKVCKQGVCAGCIHVPLREGVCLSECLRDGWMERNQTVKGDPICCVFQPLGKEPSQESECEDGMAPFSQLRERSPLFSPVVACQLGVYHPSFKAGRAFGVSIYEMPSFVIKTYFVFNEHMAPNCFKLLKDKWLCVIMAEGERKKYHFVANNLLTALIHKQSTSLNKIIYIFLKA